LDSVRDQCARGHAHRGAGNDLVSRAAASRRRLQRHQTPLEVGLFLDRFRYGILLQVWATWLVYGILVDLTDAVAEALERPFQDISLEMVYHGLYYFQQARQRGETTDLIAYLVANAPWWGLLKLRCKGAKTYQLALTGSANP